MKLTKKQIEYLREKEMEDSDILDIMLWGSDVKCYIDRADKKHARVSYEYAIKFLGWDVFIWAIHRAMYHRTSQREHISFVNTKWGW